METRPHLFGSERGDITASAHPVRLDHRGRTIRGEDDHRSPFDRLAGTRRGVRLQAWVPVPTRARTLASGRARTSAATPPIAPTPAGHQLVADSDPPHPPIDRTVNDDDLLAGIDLESVVRPISDPLPLQAPGGEHEPTTHQIGVRTRQGSQLTAYAVRRCCSQRRWETLDYSSPT